MKIKLLSIALLAFTLLTTHAATYSTNNMAATNGVLFSTAQVLTRLTLFSTNTAPTIVHLFNGGLTTVNGAYTNYTLVATNEVESWITLGGTTNTMTNLVLKSFATAVAAATNAATPRITIVVPANNVPITWRASDYGGGAVFPTSINLSNSLPGLSFIMTTRTP